MHMLTNDHLVFSKKNQDTYTVAENGCLLFAAIFD